MAMASSSRIGSEEFVVYKSNVMEATRGVLVPCKPSSSLQAACNSNASASMR